jgi:aryl-alcohol dehydrogenase-like predicted oxidoreductase
VGFGGSPLEMALRFTCFTAGVSTAIVGSTNLDHMKENLRILEQGPLDESVVKEIRKLWTVNDTGDWVGQG